jgi:hypothetical protein
MIEPGLRHQNPGRYERQVFQHPEALRCTAPRPVLDVADQPERHGTTFDRHAMPDQFAARSQRHRDDGLWRYSESLLGRCPPGSCYPAQQLIEWLGARRTHDHVPRIGQQAVREQADRMRGQPLLQCLEKRAVPGGCGHPVAGRNDAPGEVEVVRGVTWGSHRVPSWGGR